MSETTKPKRFDLEPTTLCGESWLEMVAHTLGDWVLYDEYEELLEEVRHLRNACEAVVAAAHGNRSMLTAEEILKGQLIAAMELELAMPEDEVKRIAEKYGFEPYDR